MSAVVAIFPCASLTAYGIAYGLKNNKHIHRIVGITSNGEHCDVTDVESFDTILYNVKRPCGDFGVWHNLLRKHNITHVIPANDDAVQLFSGITGGPTKYMVPDKELCIIVHNKKLTYAMWPEISPAIYPNSTIENWYIKPSVGHSAQGCRPATKNDDLDTLTNHTDWVVCEQLYGAEYTVECMGGELVGARERCLTRNGMSVVTKKVEPTDSITRIFNIVAPTVVKFYSGPWFFQVKGDKLLEIQTRLPGMSSSVLMWGRNLVVEWIQNVVGYSVNTPVTHITKRMVDNVSIHPDFSPSAIVVDWDDTIRIGKTQVNHEFLGSLYAIHKFIPIILCSRHKSDRTYSHTRGDLLQSMSNCCVDPNLFDRIQHISSGQEKSGPPNSILVDDSFTERLAWAKCGKPAFDVSTAIPILRALSRRRNVVDQTEKCEARYTPLNMKLVDSTYIKAKPSVVDELQLYRLRQHIVEFEKDIWKDIGGSVQTALDIGPDINPWKPVGHIHVDTLDLPGVSKGLVGDITDYVPNSDERYDYVRLSEVMEHCIHPWNAPESLWKLLKPGGWAFVSVPYNFRLHGPNPDGFRFSPEGLKSMFGGWLELAKMSILNTPGSPLSPTHVCALFQKSMDTKQQQIQWALDKGVSGIQEAVKNKQFANNGTLVQKLEKEWINKMGLDPEKFEAVACCNGTIGLAALVYAHNNGIKWSVQRNSFWSDIQNGLRDATVLPMDPVRGGPMLGNNNTNLVVTSVFGQMSKDTQRYYIKHAQNVIIFDHAAVCDPSKYEVGDGAMFSLHETKPMGRGEGGIVVVPKAKASAVRAYISFGNPKRHTTNGKMSEIVAAAILEWWTRWEKFVKEKFMEQIEKLKELVSKSEHIDWLYPEQVVGGASPASFAIKVVHNYDITRVQAESRLPVKQYYQPLDGVITQDYTRSMVCPIKPFVDFEEYVYLVNVISVMRT